MSDPALDALLAKLHPVLRPRAIAWLSACNDLYLPVQFPQFKVRITITGRTEGEQAAAFASGLSNVKLGWHQITLKDGTPAALAWDFVVLDANGDVIKNGDHPAYRCCGNAALPLDCHYPIYLGPNQTRPDADHIEYHPGFTLSQALAWLQAGKDLFA